MTNGRQQRKLRQFLAPPLPLFLAVRLARDNSLALSIRTIKSSLCSTGDEAMSSWFVNLRRCSRTRFNIKHTLVFATKPEPHQLPGEPPERLAVVPTGSVVVCAYRPPSWPTHVLRSDRQARHGPLTHYE
jgi:hypothetical protein